MRNAFTTPKGIISIQASEPDDAALVRELRLESLSKHPEVFAADYDSTAEESVEVWAERITKYATGNKGLISIALNGNQLIGMTGVVRGNHPKTQHIGTIWGVYVKADFRGFHIAEALINKCISWAQSQGLVSLKLGVIITNISAICCYSRCGFTTYGIDPKVIYYNGVFYDELLMAKQI